MNKLVSGYLWAWTNYEAGLKSVNSLKKFTAIYGAAGSYGSLYKEEIISGLLIAGGMYKGKLAKKLDAKTRIFAPIIVRGEESEGVKLWQFGKEVYQDFLNMAADEEIGDYTDIVNGRDITVETSGPESTGTQYNKSSVRVRLKETQLSEDAALVEKWSNDQPDPTKEFKQFSFEEMKSALEKWLEPEGGEDSNIDATPTETSTVAAPSNFSLDTNNVKKNKVDEFDTLFDSKDGKTDDLPF